LVVKCHTCGVEKIESNQGFYLCWQFGREIKYKVIVWFHDNQCKENWKKSNLITKFKEIKYSDNVGITKILTDNPDDEFNDTNNEI